MKRRLLISGVSVLLLSLFAFKCDKQATCTCTISSSSGVSTEKEHMGENSESLCTAKNGTMVSTATGGTFVVSECRLSR